MKGTTILLVTGAVVMGVVAYDICKSLQKQNAAEKEATKTAVRKNSIEERNTQEPPDSAPLSRETAVESFNQAAERASDSIGTRHKEAAQMMNDMLSQIAADSIEFEEKASHTRNALEILLKGE